MTRPAPSSIPARARVGLGLVLAAAAAVACAAAAPITSDRFAPEWQANAAPLYSQGPAPFNMSSTSWVVPSILKPGRYVLIQRDQDGGAHVIDGYGFTMRRTGVQDVRVIVPSGYGNVEALPERFVPDVSGKLQPTEGR